MCRDRKFNFSFSASMKIQDFDMIVNNRQMSSGREDMVVVFVSGFSTAFLIFIFVAFDQIVKIGKMFLTPGPQTDTGP